MKRLRLDIQSAGNIARTTLLQTKYFSCTIYLYMQIRISSVRWLPYIITSTRGIQSDLPSEDLGVGGVETNKVDIMSGGIK